MALFDKDIIMLKDNSLRETFYTCKRSEWREWLSENYQKKQEVWLVFPTKSSGEPSILYNDAVEEALCFGWIDSTTGHIDELHGVRRFTPRKNENYYSRPNIERLIWLDKQGLILPEIRKKIVGLINEPYIFPADILNEIKKDAVAWANYENFTEPYKRIRIAYIDAARERPDEFEKRLKNFMEKTQKNMLIVGYGGIEKYYK